MLWLRLVVLGSVCLGSVGCSTNHDPVGLRLRSVALVDLDARPVDPWQENADVTVFVFTRSDCPISNRSAPEVCRLYEEFQPRGVQFYLIYVDPREQTEAIRRHMKEYNYPCRALRDLEHSLVAYCGASVTPEAVVFNKSRELVYRGRIDDLYRDFGQARTEPTTHDLEDAIESTLSDRKIATPRTKAVGCVIMDLKG